MSDSKRDRHSGNPRSQARRRFVEQGIALAGAAGIAPGLLTPRDAYAADSTEWGWPLPYRQVSEKSVAWLKSKGWWPLQVGWNPLWSDGNVVLFAMQHYKLLQQRGVEVAYPPLLAASLFNEVYAPARIQVAQAGSLGLLRVIDLKIPTAALATYPAQRQAFLVPPDSPLKTGMAELKGKKVLGRPAVFGTTIGEHAAPGHADRGEGPGTRRGQGLHDQEHGGLRDDHDAEGHRHRRHSGSRT